MQSTDSPQSRPMMTIQESVMTCLRKYADFSGRATRAEYWWWVLATIIVSFAVGAVDGFIGSLTGDYIYSPLSALFGLAVLLPDLAVTCRRLHDIGRSGWWQLAWFIIGFLGAIPLIVGIIVFVISGFSGSGDWKFGSNWELDVGGLVTLLVGIALSVIIWLGLAIWWLVWMVKQGQAGPNHYGPDPRAWDADGGGSGAPV